MQAVFLSLSQADMALLYFADINCFNNART
jgi:hypothetical protein